MADSRRSSVVGRSKARPMGFETRRGLGEAPIAGIEPPHSSQSLASMLGDRPLVLRFQRAQQVELIQELQHRHGNGEVARMLVQTRERSTARGSAVVQRYDTGEHAQMGSKEIVVVNGVEFTRAQIGAMGDFYESYDQMKHADPAELKRLKRDIEAQTKYYKKEPGGRDVPEGKGGWDEDTGGRYLKLAQKNDTHFAPGAVTQGKDHKTSWESYHTQALQYARGAAVRNPNQSIEVPQEAQAINAFGNHFLEDSFAAGHLIPKADVMQAAEKSFKDQKHTDSWWQPYFYRNGFTDRVAAIVMGDPRARLFDKYRLKLIAYRDIDAHRLSEFLFQFAKREPDIFYSNIVKVVHDQFNHATAEGQKKNEPVSEFWVENQKGDKWALTGDTTLSSSPETLRIINEALAQAEANLAEAVTAPVPTNPIEQLLDPFAFRIPELLDRVWSYTPQPTAETRRRMDKVVAQSTDLGDPLTAQRFAEVILDNLSDIVDGLEKRGILATKEKLHKEAQEMIGHPSL